MIGFKHLFQLPLVEFFLKKRAQNLFFSLLHELVVNGD